MFLFPTTGCEDVGSTTGLKMKEKVDTHKRLTMVESVAGMPADGYVKWVHFFAGSQGAGRPVEVFIF